MNFDDRSHGRILRSAAVRYSNRKYLLSAKTLETEVKKQSAENLHREPAETGVETKTLTEDQILEHTEAEDMEAWRRTKRSSSDRYRSESHHQVSLTKKAHKNYMREWMNHAKDMHTLSKLKEQHVKLMEQYVKLTTESERYKSQSECTESSL
ncbi:hypothetical protein BGX33_005361 [Mortierella sp. NVP41]|nr:hypothetical protein BGX33_005361 [Mortierella sp. NVP41]